MRSADLLTIRAAAHPDPAVRRFGFPLDHRYVEGCWAGVIGPSCTLLLRHLALRWRETEPLVTTVRELGSSIGPGPSRLERTLNRLAQFKMAERHGSHEWSVHTHLAPLSETLLEGQGEWVRRLHDQLLDEHLEHLAQQAQPAATYPTARLDHLQHHRPPTTPEVSL